MDTNNNEEFVPTEQQGETFEKIVRLVDIGEEMLDGIESPEVKNPDELVDIVEPLINEIEAAVGVVTEEFLAHIKDGEKTSKERSDAVDMAMKKIYEALYAMKEKGEAIHERLQTEG